VNIYTWHKLWGLNTFLSEKFKEMIIDDAGWGDLILGVVIGALKFPGQYMERRIPVSSFQPPTFESRKYLTDAVKIVEEVVKAMNVDKETCFKICSGYGVQKLAFPPKCFLRMVGKDFGYYYYKRTLT